MIKRALIIIFFIINLTNISFADLSHNLGNNPQQPATNPASDKLKFEASVNDAIETGNWDGIDLEKVAKDSVIMNRMDPKDIPNGILKDHFDKIPDKKKEGLSSTQLGTAGKEQWGDLGQYNKDAMSEAIASEYPNAGKVTPKEGDTIDDSGTLTRKDGSTLDLNNFKKPVSDDGDKTTVGDNTLDQGTGGTATDDSISFDDTQGFTSGSGTYFPQASGFTWFDYGGYKFNTGSVKDGPLHLNNANNVEKQGGIVTADTITQGSTTLTQTVNGQPSSFTTTFDNVQQAYFMPNSFAFQSVDSLTITQNTTSLTYIISDANNITFDGQNLLIDHADSVIIGNNIIAANADNIKIPFTFTYELFDISFELDNYQEILVERSDLVQIGDRTYTNLSNARFITNNDTIVYANVTAKTHNIYEFENPLFDEFYFV